MNATTIIVLFSVLCYVSADEIRHVLREKRAAGPQVRDGIIQVNIEMQDGLEVVRRPRKSPENKERKVVKDPKPRLLKINVLKEEEVPSKVMDLRMGSHDFKHVRKGKNLLVLKQLNSDDKKP